MKKIKIILSVLLAVTLILSGCANKSEDTSKERTKTDTPVTDESPASEGAESSEPTTEASDSDMATEDAAPSESSSESSDSLSKNKDSGSSESIAEAPSSSSDSKESAPSDSVAKVPTAPDTMGQEPPESQKTPKPEAGLLTAGEWNDNENYEFWLDLMQKNNNWNTFSNDWDMNVSRRIVADVFSGSKPIANAKVELITSNNQVVWTAKTNNQGRAYLFNGIQETAAGKLTTLRATVNGEEKTVDIDSPNVIHKFSFGRQQLPEKVLELSFVVDTTGSMGDELDYLIAELEGVVKRVSSDNANIPVRTAATVYRDEGDDYVVRNNYLTDDVKETVRFLSKQKARGGGDWEEAVEQALDAAIHDQTWNKNATARIMVLVLDAPPHNTPKIRQEMVDLMNDAAEAGIVIIPVASSGIDKYTEYLLRSMAISTGGTYVFLTDDSGIGGSHIEPTVGYYQVESLDDLLVRVINEYVQ